VGSCAALLAVIGPTWLKVADEAGLRRLDDPHDFVRIEIEAALKRSIRVVPVLVGGAAMPKVGELPRELESFVRRQAHELSDSRWDYDVQHLIDTLEKSGIKPLVKPQVGNPFWSRRKMAFVVGAVVVAMVGYAYSHRGGGIDQSKLSSVSENVTTPQTFSNPGQPPAGSSATNPIQPTVPEVTSHPAARRPSLSYAGFDAIGRQPSIVQVFNPT